MQDNSSQDNVKKYIADIKQKVANGERITKEERTLFDQITVKLKRDSFYNFCKEMTGYDIAWFQKVIIDKAEEIFRTGSGRLMTQMIQQHGKAVSINELCKIPNGWKKISDLKINDKVDSGQGFYSKVTGIYPQGKRALYRIKFEDSRSCLCDYDHLWEVSSIRFNRKKAGHTSKVLTTGNLIELIKTKKYKDTLYIPRYIPIEEKNTLLDIDPYLLGALIGNGCLTGNSELSFSSSDEFTINKVDNILRQYNSKLIYRSNYNYGISVGDIKNLLKKLNMIGCYANNKFIPETYKNASYSQRVELIQGLMDTDGTIMVGKGDNISLEYCTVSYQLALDFQYLIRSIGGLCNIRAVTEPKYTHKGEKLIGQCAYRCSIRISNQKLLFSLPRKKDIAKEVHRRSESNKRLRIKSIEFEKEEEAICISVDNERGLYVINDYIVTHNSQYLGILFPAYIMGHHPEWKLLYLTYSDARACEISAKLLAVVTDEKYQKLFPNFKLKDELSEDVRAAKKRRHRLGISNFTNANSLRGEWKATGIEGSYNGYDANLIILDDYFSGQQEAMSDTVNDTRWLCWTRNILTRQQKDTIIIIIGTQWRHDDIIGKMTEYIKKLPEGALPWEHIIFNAVKDERDYPYDHRKIGEYLWPEMKMNFYIEYSALDPIGWAITAMNMPESMNNKLFNPSSFRIYDVVPDASRMIVIISCDPNYSKISRQGDESAIVVVGLQEGKCYILETWGQARVSHQETMAQINYYKQKYPNYFSVLIEDRAGGEAICQLFEESGERRLERFINNDCKRTRAQFMLPYCNEGKVLIPNKKLNPAIDLYTKSFYNFNGEKGGKEDYVDATSQVFVHYGYLLAPAILKQAYYKIGNKYSISSKTNIFGKHGSKKKSFF